MSVLNDMLRSLEARGGPAPSAAPARPLPMAVPAAGGRRRQTIWLSSLIVALAVGGALYWSARPGQPPLTPGSTNQRGALDAPAVQSPVASATVENAADAPVHVAALAAQPSPLAPAGAAAAALPAAPAPAATLQAAALAAAPMPAGFVAPAPSAAAAPTAASTARAANSGREPVLTQPAVRRTATSAITVPSAPSAADASVSTPSASAEVRRSSASRNDPDADLARAADLIARGRNSEAIPLLQQILATHPRQANARQALATLQFETGQPLLALATLLEGAALDPGSFALPAARLQAGLGDPAGALATLERVPASARTPAQHAMHGGLAHRLGRHALAIDSYRLALRSPQAEAVWWLGLGLAHEAAAQPEAARAALKQALAQTALTPEQRGFAQQRLLAVRAGEPGIEAVAAASQ